jgi:hypothetical protein
VIVVVCSDKGSPGVTTLATVLALAWPDEPILAEADPSGGDLSLRLHAPGTQYLAREPSMLTLATAVRSGAYAGGAAGFVQQTSLGIRVIPGPPVDEAWTPMLRLWAPVAARLRDWPGTVIVDMGRLQSGHPAIAVAQTADVVLLLTTATVEGLFHARERARGLERVLGEEGPHSRVAVVVRSGNKGKGSLNEVTQVLRNLVPVVGGFADDRSGVEMLLAGSNTAQLRRSALMRSGTQLVARIQRAWPTRAASAPSSPTETPVRLLGDPQ